LNERNDGYRRVLADDDESLAIFLRGMSKFDRLFCEQMMEGSDFTLRLEVRGNRGKLVHSRVSTDRFEKQEPGKR